MSRAIDEYINEELLHEDFMNNIFDETDLMLECQENREIDNQSNSISYQIFKEGLD